MMARLVGKVVLVVMGFLATAGAGAQGNYSPGQTFSAGGAPTPTPVPYGNYAVPPPTYRAPVQRTPQQQLPVQRPAAAPMYNMLQTEQSRRPSITVERERVSENETTEKEKPSAKRDDSSNKPESEQTSKSSNEDKSEKSSSSRDTTDEKEKSSSQAGDSNEEKAESKADVKADDKPVVAESTDKLTFFSRKTGKKEIALTYDDGPNPTLTPELIEYLKANNVPATFFMLGEMVKTHPELAKQVADDGFEVANHTYDHPDLRSKSPEKIRSELQETHDLIKSATGVDVKLMRPPYGAHNSKVDKVCEDMGYKIILWDVDTEDWRKKSTESIINTIMHQAGDGSIILMHDRKHAGKKTVLEATKSVVPQLRAKGYTFVTVGQIIGLTNNAGSRAVAAGQSQLPTPVTIDVTTTEALAVPISNVAPVSASDAPKAILP